MRFRNCDCSDRETRKILCTGEKRSGSTLRLRKKGPDITLGPGMECAEVGGDLVEFSGKRGIHAIHGTGPSSVEPAIVQARD